MKATDADALAQVVADVINKAITPLQRRLTLLEAAPQLRFCFAWNESTTYQAGSIVQKGGALWLAIATSTGAAPGSGAGNGLWRLVLKSGARDR
jgi:hypothetical protein